MKYQRFVLEEDFILENGARLEKPTIGYHTAGTLNAARDNVVWVFHGLTANSNPCDWWSGLFGPQKVFDPEEYFIICVAALGSNYGEEYPLDLGYPLFTVRDVSKLQLKLFNILNINEIKFLVGGSFGGSQALEFALGYTGKIHHLITVASAPQESAWGIAIHQAQRLAIQADDSFGKPQGGLKGLKAARAIGLLSYRTPTAYINTQTDDSSHWPNRRASSYIDYQGQKLVNRFEALSYFYLTQCLDSHDIGRGRGGVAKALQRILSKALVIGIDTDQLVLPELQQEMARQLPHGQYVSIHSKYGHDGFLLETQQIEKHIKDFIKSK
ncbi:homoserine O-acetyltransferase [bacterium SCSIO 12741]|nr:homoserine O-acetyltransferase [bacterium SCSIO 12741]